MEPKPTGSRRKTSSSRQSGPDDEVDYEVGQDEEPEAPGRAGSSGSSGRQPALASSPRRRTQSEKSRLNTITFDEDSFVDVPGEMFLNAAKFKKKYDEVSCVATFSSKLIQQLT